MKTTSEKKSTYESPRWSYEFPDCSMPLTFDQYSMCGYGCIYCFSQFQKAVGNAKEHYLNKDVRSVDIPFTKRMFQEGYTGKFIEYIKARKVMQWGGLADPFCPYEKKFGTGLELLRFFREIDYPLSLSTKGTWWLDDARYTELFKDNPNWHIKFSIITLDERKAKVVEAGVPSPMERLEAIQKFTDLKAGGATLRLRPFILGISEPDHCKLIKLAGEAGAISLSTEFFCMETRSKVARSRYKLLSQMAGFDLFKFYKRYSLVSGYLRLNRNVKRDIINQMEAACREAGMAFYVSDAHFKERCDNGSCCGLPERFNYSRGQFTEALLLCKKNGTVRWSDFSDDNKFFKTTKYKSYIKSSSEKRGSFWTHTIDEFMRWLWNNPHAGQSPYKYFEGIMKPVGKDEDGDLIYEYDESRA